MEGSSLSPHGVHSLPSLPPYTAMSITDIWDPVKIAGIREIIKTRQQDGWDEAWLASFLVTYLCCPLLTLFSGRRT